MNSTDDPQLAELIGQLFDEVVLPRAARMQAEGVQAFPLTPDACWLSYYVRRRQSSMTRADFGAPSCVDVEDFELRLAAHWRSLGRLELAAQAARFGAVARDAKALFAASAPQAELSPYVYAMF